MTKIEYRGEVLPGYVPGLPEDMVKVQRKAGLFLIPEIENKERIDDDETKACETEQLFRNCM